MEFVDTIFAIILAAFAQRGAQPTSVDEARLMGVAEDMVEVAEQATDLPFEGEGARMASVVALATVAYHESGFWEKVQTCEICYPGSRWCDQGRSVSLYQLREGSSSFGEYTRKEICADNKIATERALAVLARHKRASNPNDLFNGYARGGVGSFVSKPAQEMGEIFSRLSKRAGVRVRYVGGKMRATIVPVESDKLCKRVANLGCV